MSFLLAWNNVYSSIASYARSLGISNVSKGKPGYIPQETPFVLCFGYPLPRSFGEGAQAQRKKMEIVIFVATANEDLATGIEHTVDLAEQIGDMLVRDYPQIISCIPEFDSLHGNNIIASLTVSMYYRD